MKSLGLKSFYDCEGLESVEISPMNSIGDDCFSEITELNYVKYNGTVNPCKTGITNKAFINAKTKEADVWIGYEEGDFCGLKPTTGGKCGDGCKWTYDHELKHLTIIGTGENVIMNDY